MDRNNEHWQSLALFLAAVIIGRVKKDKGERSIVNGRMMSRHNNVRCQDLAHYCWLRPSVCVGLYTVGFLYERTQDHLFDHSQP